MRRHVGNMAKTDIGEYGSCARVLTTRLGVDARWLPTLLLVPVVSLHAPSKWVFRKNIPHNPLVHSEKEP